MRRRSCATSRPRRSIAPRSRSPRRYAATPRCGATGLPGRGRRGGSSRGRRSGFSSRNVASPADVPDHEAAAASPGAGCRSRLRAQRRRGRLSRSTLAGAAATAHRLPSRVSRLLRRKPLAAITVTEILVGARHPARTTFYSTSRAATAPFIASSRRPWARATPSFEKDGVRRLGGPALPRDAPGRHSLACQGWPPSLRPVQHPRRMASRAAPQAPLPGVHGRADRHSRRAEANGLPGQRADVVSGLRASHRGWPR